MKERRLFEDILDDIERIKPDVPEDALDIFVPEPGYGHSAFIMLWGVDPDSDYLIGRISDVLDAKTDEWRVGEITGIDRMRDFASMFSDQWKDRLIRAFNRKRCIIVVQFSCPLKTAFETYIFLMRFVRRAFHSFRVTDDHLEHISFTPDAPRMINNLFNDTSHMNRNQSDWHETYCSRYKNVILKELVELVTGDSDENESAFRAAEKIFRRIMKRNNSPK